MRVKRWLLAGIACVFLTGMRDPFKPPEDLCRISELSQWRYQGMVGARRAHHRCNKRWAKKNGDGCSKTMCWKTAGRSYS